MVVALVAMGAGFTSCSDDDDETGAGGGAVTVTVNGKKEVLNIVIEESVVDPEDIEMLQDLVMAAINEALRSADEMMEKEMKKLTGGMNIPGLF